MPELIRLAYLEGLFLWIPLAYFALTLPAARRWLVAPIVASALAAAYEAYMTFVWEPKVTAPIRVDILLVLFALAAANTISGLALVVSARGRAERRQWWAAAILCFSVPVLALAGLAFMSRHMAQLDVALDQGKRFRFEAAFRDDKAEARAFDNLKSETNPWAGYYLAGDEDDRFKHLVINDAGRFWLYHSKLYEYKGIGKQSATDPARFEGKGSERMDERMTLALQRQESGQYLLTVDFGYAPSAPKTVPIRKANAPRFAQSPSPTDEVRFVGVFSGTYGERERDGAFWLVQVWLWESKGEVWGRYEHDVFKRGERKEFIHAEEIAPACAQQCKVLSFKTSRGPRILTRISDDELRGTYGSPAQEVTLRRGEILPGFPLDLAPLGTEKQNRVWIKAVLEGHMITWDVPAK
jgi:hypothetical protein